MATLNPILANNDLIMVLQINNYQPPIIKAYNLFLSWVLIMEKSICQMMLSLQILYTTTVDLHGSPSRLYVGLQGNSPSLIVTLLRNLCVISLAHSSSEVIESFTSLPMSKSLDSSFGNISIRPAQTNDLSKQLFVEFSLSDVTQNVFAEPTQDITSISKQSRHQMIARHKLRTDPSLPSDMVLITTKAFQFVEPKMLRTAMKDPRWVNAVKDELNTLESNQTWSLVPRRDRKCCWIKMGV